MHRPIARLNIENCAIRRKRSLHRINTSRQRERRCRLTYNVEHHNAVQLIRDYVSLSTVRRENHLCWLENAHSQVGGWSDYVVDCWSATLYQRKRQINIYYLDIRGRQRQDLGIVRQSGNDRWTRAQI